MTVLVIDYALGDHQTCWNKEYHHNIQPIYWSDCQAITGSGLPGEKIHYVLEETPEGVANVESCKAA